MPQKPPVLDELLDQYFSHAARLQDEPLNATTHHLAAFARDARLALTIWRRGSGSTYATQQQQRTQAEQKWAATRYREDE